jgi:hypothetical protein
MWSNRANCGEIVYARVVEVRASDNVVPPLDDGITPRTRLRSGITPRTRLRSVSQARARAETPPAVEPVVLGARQLRRRLASRARFALDLLRLVRVAAVVTPLVAPRRGREGARPPRDDGGEFMLAEEIARRVPQRCQVPGVSPCCTCLTGARVQGDADARAAPPERTRRPSRRQAGTPHHNGPAVLDDVRGCPCLRGPPPSTRVNSQPARVRPTVLPLEGFRSASFE